MTVNDFLRASGMSIHALAMAAGISYTTLHPHAKRGRAISVATARKLEAYDSRLSAVEILGLNLPTTPGPRAKKTRKAEPAPLVVSGAA